MSRWSLFRVAPLLSRALLAMLACAGAGGASAQVAVNQILFPVNIGRTLDATVTIDYTRTSAAPAVVTTPIPSQLSVDPPAPPAGCTVVAGPAVECTVPAGASGSSGSLSFTVRGAVLGSFSLVATATGGSSASNTGTVRSSGDLTVLKSRLPAGNLVTGQSTSFSLQPQVAAGADSLPAGASITVTDQLPGTETDFKVSAISGGIGACTSVASANASRTVTCTLNGPLSVAAIEAVTITITGAPGTTGTFTNVGSISVGSTQYLDRDPDNNTASVNYTVDPGGDVQALASFPSGAVVGSSAQTLTLSTRNNGPLNLPAGGTVQTTIPAGFTVVSLPAACSGPATGVVLGAPTVLSCTAAAAPVGSTQGFPVPLLMPAGPGSGSFTVTVAPPPGFGDALASNNSVSVPWAVVDPYADLRIGKSKSPAGGPIAPGTTVTTTLTVTNDAASPSAAVFSAAGGGTELRVIDYLRPEEVAADALTTLTAGWTCTLTADADPTNAARSRRVSCVRSDAGSLAPGASLAVSFRTTVAAVVGQLTLANRACTGETMLSELGLTPAQGPQPPGSGQSGNDCATAGATLVVTDVVSGSAAVTLRKESSIDGSTWFDPVAAAPTLAASAETQFWRITVTTPSGGNQAPIPTLNLADTLPGILNVASPGVPAPSHVTPAIAVSTNVTAGAATGSCPSLAAGASALNCSFSNVAPGTTLVVSYAVQRPVASGTLTNTARLSSPDALLSGTTSDSAAIVVQPRTDVAATTKTVTPATPRIGQAIQFTITTQNLGPDTVSAPGEFKITDDLNTSVAGATVAFGDIVASGTAMTCEVAASALPDEAALPADHVRVRCLNTAAVTRYATRTITIGARVLKPAGLPGAGNVYTAQTNTARVDIPDTQCEFKTETSSNANVSAACNDTASTSNNTRSVSFDVLVPQIDVQQRKTRVLPAGQTQFGVGQPLRYRFRLQNNGPSRAEGVSMTDQLSVPAGFTLASPQVLNVNAAAAEAGYVLDTGKNASVSCSQAGPNADVVCVLAPTAAASYLDPGREVNFEIELSQAGTSLTPVSFGNEALVCADEATAGFETAGACNRVTANNNNVASVNDVIFPRSDLSLSKSTVSPSPVGLNQPVEFRLLATNLGPSALQQLRIVDTLPPGFELVTGGAQAPSLVLGAAVTQPPSTATGASLACTAAPATLTLANQQQVVTCVIDATPGPLGAGAFPPGSGSSHALSLRLFARPLPGLFTGPWRTDRSNSATVSPGLDGSGDPLVIDTNSGNNTSASVVQVARSALRGRVFFDRNGNGAQDGTTPAADVGLAGVTITLLGTDAWGNAIARTTTTLDTADATRGDFRFDDLPPGNYTLTETQPTDYANSPGQPAPPTAGLGTYAAAASVVSSRWSNITLGLGSTVGPYLFPETQPGTTVSGRVFSDRNGNGNLDVADAGIADVTVGLYLPGTTCPATGDLPADPLQTLSTDAGGRYTFTGVPIGGSYVICQRQPEGHADRNPVPGVAGSTPRANQIDIVNLPADGSPGNDFPEVLGHLSGLVFFDHNPSTPATNDNGTPEAGEAPIGSAVAGAGVPITLTGTPSAGPGAGSAITPRTTTTAADGSWRFDDLLPGTYTVTQGAIPLLLGTYNEGLNSAGPVSSGSAGVAGARGDNAIRNIVLGAAGASGSDNRFAEIPRAAIWGLVFVDANRDRAFTSADRLRIPDVEIELRQGGSSCADATLLGSTRSAADGTWVFPGGTVTAGQVVAGQDYRVCERQPADWNDGPTLPGVSSTSAMANQILIRNLPDTGSGLNIFGEWTRPAADVSAPIAGTVFVDRNRDGQMTDADPGRLSGVVVRLVEGISCSGTEIGRTLTDGSGRYAFPGGNVTAAQVVQGRAYSVCQLQPEGYGDGAPRPGNGATSPGANHLVIAALPAGGSSGNDFGEWGSRVAGRVYLDRDGDGAPGAGEPGIGGVAITLQGVSGPFVTRTNTDGSFAWEDLPGGRWTLTEQAEQPVVEIDGQAVETLDGRTTAGTGGGQVTPLGTTPSRIAELDVPLGGQSVDNLFGEVPAATLSGRVWLDASNDGRIDPGEDGLRNVELVLTGTDDLGRAVRVRQTTGPDGRYRFGGLRSGVYTVTEPAQPPGTEDGITVAGSTGGSVTPVGTTPSAIGGVGLGTGQNSVGNNFGEVTGAPGLVVSKTAQDAPFMVGQTGAYRIQVRNAGNTPTVGAYTVSDRLPAGLSLAAAPAGSGWACSGAAGDTRFDCSSAAVIGPGALSPAVIELQVRVSEAAAANSPAFNAVLVEGGGERADQAPTGDERERFANRPETLPVCAQTPLHNACRAGTAVIRPSSLGGRVWLDASRDGRIDESEAGIPGVTVVLTGTDDLGRTVSLTQVTGPDGRYDFTGLRPGRYTVTEPTQPPGTVNGLTVPGSTGGVATGVDSTPSAIRDIPLAAGQRSADNNFGEHSASPDLVVGKASRDARLLVGKAGQYRITVRNQGSGPTTAAFTVSDRMPAGVTLAGPPAGAGWACTGAAGDSSFSCSHGGVLAAGERAALLEVPVQVSDAARAATPVSNAVLVEGGGESSDVLPSADERDRHARRPDALPVCTEPPTHNACRSVTDVQQPAALSGTVWLDLGPDRRQLDPADQRLAGWVVELVDPDTGRVLASTLTGPDGRYRFADLDPGVALWVRFRDPASGIVHGNPVNGETGVPAAPCIDGAVPRSCSVGRNDPHLRVVLAPGQELTQQSLPVRPTGTVYDADSRNPLPGAEVTLQPVGSCPAWDPSTQVAGATLGGYTVAGTGIRMRTGANGFYLFLLLDSAPARCVFALTIEPPPGYLFPSETIPAQEQPLRPAGPADGAVQVQPQVQPPVGEVGPATAYHTQLDIGSSTPAVENNHIPLDPVAPAALVLRKTGDRAVAELGDTVRYRISVRLAAGSAPRQVTVLDRLPAGFTYVPGTALLDGRRLADPAGAPGPRLAFQLGALPAGGAGVTLQYRVRVGVGAQQGDGINRAVAWACNAAAGCLQPGGTEPLATARASNEGVYRVRVAGGVFALEACVLGKVFVDCNGNHVQDREELGIPGVRMVLQDGTFLTSDSEGKVSMCGLPPRSHVLRIDELTLPRGSRLTTSSNRNLGDAGSLWLDLRYGELQRADFIEGSCSNTVLDQVKARRAQGEVSAPQLEKAGRPALRFDSKAHGLNPLTTPPQGTDSANQRVPKPRAAAAGAGAASDERNLPVPSLPMNRPPPDGRRSSDAPDAPASTEREGSHGTR